MDPSLQALVTAGRFEDAATLAAASGQAALASDLWERACDFGKAAEWAMHAGDAERALILATRAGAHATEDAAIEALSAGPGAPGAAARLHQLGKPLVAARLLIAAGNPGAAARELEAAGALFDAARAHRAAGAPREEARCLEALLTREPAHHTARVDLGRLLLAHGRNEAALRTLQQVPVTAPERSAALPLLHTALERLDLAAGLLEIEAELAARGVTDAARPSTCPPAAPTEVLFGRYLVLREAARTPTARVLEARDEVSGAHVAVKLYAAHTLREAGRDALLRFEREARVLGELRHPAIVPLVAYHAEGPAVVLPWMDGGSLADRLATGPLAPAGAAEITLAVLDALDAAHRRGILHRDVKPANVLFDAAGAPYLADFGTAHVSDAATTVTSGVIGTLSYMAPEQRAGAPATIASDVYGAGALLWHALTGAPPGVADQPESPELAPEHWRVARRLIGPLAERPSQASIARELVASISWPRTTPAPRSPTPAPVARATCLQSVRLAPRDGALHYDTLLGREVLVLPADAEALSRAAWFARAGHPCLATVLCHRSDARTVWIEALPGPPAALTATDIAPLRDALAALHAAGGHHGAVDRDHIVRRGSQVALRFPSALPPGTPARDLEQLAQLAPEAAP